MGDRVIWVVFFFLCVISLVEVFSAASTLVYESGNFWGPLVKQAAFLAVGTVVVVIVHRIPCRMFKALPIILWPVSLVLLAITLGTSDRSNDAARWFDMGLFTFQPSELAKGTVVITVALILSRMQGPDGADKRAFKWIMWVVGPVCVLILPENLSTAALLFGVVVLMMLIGRVPLVQLGKMIGVLVLTVSLFIIIAMVVPKDSALAKASVFHRVQTWEARITEHGAHVENPDSFNINDDAQKAHAHIAIASSNGIGRMPGNSVERDFLSQAFSDFIFAIIIEEMGIWGAVFVVMLYVVLLFRTGRISSRCERNFPPFLAMGLTLLIVTQAVLNMLVAVGLFPITGQPLPLISRGGTSTLFNCAYIGMILSVSRYARQVKEPQHTNFDGTMKDIRHE